MTGRSDIKGSWSKFLAILAGICWLSPAPADIVSIAAASSLKFTMPALSREFTAESGHSMRISYGSSGNFRRQILQGAPFEVFLSADEATVASLHRAGRTIDGGRVYALGRIVFYAPRGGILSPDAELHSLVAAIGKGRLNRFSIPNPDHAPYGRAARQALVAQGAWEAIQGYLVIGENAAQAARFAASGSTDGGMIPYALALAPAVSERGEFVLLPTTLHEPIRQRAVLLNKAGLGARSFYHWLTSNEARAILTNHGFQPAAS